MHFFMWAVGAFIRGNRIYKDGWNAPIGEVHYCKWKIGNYSNPYAVKVNVRSFSIAMLEATTRYRLSCFGVRSSFYKIDM